MDHEVFISYSSANIQTAQAICHALESNRIKCWMAPRDIRPGAEYGDIIEEAIVTCKVFLIVFSETSQISRWVRSELNIGFSSNKPIIPFRIDPTDLKVSMKLMLNDKHWLNAYPNPEEKFSELAAVILDLLQHPAVDTISPPGFQPASNVASADGSNAGAQGLFGKLLNQLFVKRRVKVTSDHAAEIFLNGERKGKLDAYETGNYSVSEDFYQLEVYSCEYGKKVKCEYSGSFSNSSTVIISVDMATAEKQYLMKAKNITSGQINDLGIIFLDEGKFEDAQECFLKAASMGEAAAAYNLGMMYHFGKGVEIDYDVAREYYEEAVKSDYPLALNNLGSIYYNGHGVRKDIAKSFPYFCRAAERGVESAQFTVATMLFYGQGVAVDKAKAKKWFQKAAAQGCKDSQNYLNSWVDD